MDSWLTIPFPASHVMMASFLHVNLSPTTYVQFYLTKDSIGRYTHDLLLGVSPGLTSYSKSGLNPFAPFIFSSVNQDPLTVRFRVGQDEHPYPGFRLLFTFHRVCETIVYETFPYEIFLVENALRGSF